VFQDIRPVIFGRRFLFATGKRNARDCRPARVLATSEALALIAPDRAARPADVSPVGRLLRRIGAAVLPRGVQGGRAGFPAGAGGGDVPVWIGENTFAYWRHTRLILDAPRARRGHVAGNARRHAFPGPFRTVHDAEAATLDAAGEPPRGAD
jgi:uncharacterized protein (DUF779 family)